MELKPRAVSLLTSLGGTTVLNAENEICKQNSHIAVWFLQVGECCAEHCGDGILSETAGPVGKLVLVYAIFLMRERTSLSKHMVEFLFSMCRYISETWSPTNSVLK